MWSFQHFFLFSSPFHFWKLLRPFITWPFPYLPWWLTNTILSFSYGTGPCYLSLIGLVQLVIFIFLSILMNRQLSCPAELISILNPQRVDACCWWRNHRDQRKEPRRSRSSSACRSSPRRSSPACHQGSRWVEHQQSHSDAPLTSPESPRSFFPRQLPPFPGSVAGPYCFLASGRMWMWRRLSLL